ncbi:S-layer homology domain-containing protein [Paenibacillus sp. IB182496]|uniref:S-layer homology domain-containing protein n=1 Tax=Paenibacillus sabuli TaxID=2772509 RepID=A0A927BS01_9BACL|nr:S-layer homology domain-containing protein [Paenibacillus sabuli]MBD2844836.1 S-layer homology domain-containing protein [Paenibacillus sabuli]
MESKVWKSGLIGLLSFLLVFGGFQSLVPTKMVEAAPPSLTLPDVSYRESAGLVPVAPNFALSGEGVFAGGFMEFALQDARPGESLSLATVGQAVYTKGAVSIVNTTVGEAVYLGTGSGAKPIGTVSPLGGGDAGYRIDFLSLDEISSPQLIVNGDFASGTADWTIHDTAVELGALASKTLGNPVSMVSVGSEYRISGTDGNGQPYSFISDINYSREGVDRTSTFTGSHTTQISDGALKMESNGNVSGSNNVQPYGSAFGPEAISPVFTAGAGAALAFDWKAVGGSDNYEVYGFLVDAGGQHTELMYGRGDVRSDFLTAYGTVPSDGSYQFRFVAGSYDETGGLALGAALYVDNVRVYEDVPTDAVLEQLAALVRYANVESFDNLTAPERSRTVAVTVQNINGPSEQDSQSYDIELLGRLKLIDVAVDMASPDQALLTFNASVAGAGLTVGEPIPGMLIGGLPVVVNAVNGDQVSVTLGGPLQPGDEIAYTADGEVAEAGDPANTLGDIDGNSQPTFTVTEDPLQLVEVEVEGSTPDEVTLVFNRPIDGDSLDLSGFAINGLTPLGAPINPLSVDGNRVVLKLDQPLGAGELDVRYDSGDGQVGSAFNPATNLLGDIGAGDQAGIGKSNTIEPLELIKVSTDPTDDAQLKLTFNKSLAAGGLTPGEALDGFTVGGKPVTLVGVNEAGDELIVRLDEPYQAGDQLAYDADAGDATDAANPNNKLGPITATDIPMVSGKLTGFGLSQGGEALPLEPGFEPNTNDGYETAVPNGVTDVAIAPTPYNSDDTVTEVLLNGVAVDPADGGWDNVGELQEGPNAITVNVYDKDDPAIVLDSYTVTVWRATGRLVDLEPSEGTLSPAFDADTMEYTVYVGEDDSKMTFTPTALDPEATITISVNGDVETTVDDASASRELPLREGRNTVVVTVTDRFGEIVETYTVAVFRDSPYVAPVGPRTETITVDVVIGGDDAADIAKVDITRTTHPGGRITDEVTFTPEKAQETVDKAVDTGRDLARIVIPDPADKVDETTVDVPKAAFDILIEQQVDLEIYNDNAVIHIPYTSLIGLEEDFYFRLVPVKDPQERSEAEERARTEQIVRDLAQDEQVEVVTRPMTIETNLSSRAVVLTLPLKDVELPADAAEREAYLAELAVFIEHSDGELEIVRGKVVTMADGELGLQFDINKFSTFTIIHLAVEADGVHEPYINGYPDDSFRPGGHATRAEMAAMLTRLGAAERGAAISYPDVAVSHWASLDIAAVTEADLMSGYPDGSFRSEGAITRAEMAAIVYNYLALREGGDAGRFSDVPDAHWASGIIAAVEESGLMSGYPDGSFQPGRALTRAEAVTILNRMFGRGPLHGVDTSSWQDVSTTHWAFADIEEASRDHAYLLRTEGGETLVAE